jgi:hypothetical protein
MQNIKNKIKFSSLEDYILIESKVIKGILNHLIKLNESILFHQELNEDIYAKYKR